MGDLFCPFLNRKEEREDGVGKEGRLEEGTGRGGGRERRRGNCNQAGNDKNEFKKNDPVLPGSTIPSCPLKPFSLPQDLVAWVTVGFSHEPNSETIPRMAAARNFVGFSLQPFNFLYATERHLDTTAKDLSKTRSLRTRSA